MADNEIRLTIAADSNGLSSAINNAKQDIDGLRQSAEVTAKTIDGQLSSAVEKLQSQSGKLPVKEMSAGVDYAKAVLDALKELNAFSDWLMEQRKKLNELSEEEKRSIDDAAQSQRTDLEIGERKLAIKHEGILLGKTESEQHRLRAEWAAQDYKADQDKLTNLNAQYEAAQQIVKQYNAWLAAAEKLKNPLANPPGAFIQKPPVGDSPPRPDDEKVRAAKETIERLDGIYGKGLADLRVKTATEGAMVSLQLKQAGEAQLQESVRAHLAQIEAQKTDDDAKLQRDQQTIQALHSQHVISDEDELTLLRVTINKKYTEEGEYLQKKLAQLQRVNNTGQIAAVNAQILSLQARQDSELIKLDDDYYQQVEKNGQQAVQNAAARNKKILSDLRAAREQAMQAVAENEKVQDQVEEQAVEQRFLRGKISRQQEITQIAALKRDELQIEINFLKDKEKFYQNDANRVREIEQQITKLQGQQLVIRAKAVTDSLKAEEKEYQQLWKSIGSTFKSTIDGLLQGNETIAQAFQKLYTQLIQSAANYFEQMLMKRVEDYVMSKLFAQKDAGSSIAASSGKAMAAGVASVMAALPFPANIAAAPGVGAEAAAMATGPSMALLNSLDSAAGGQYRVTASEQMTALHRNEMVLPAGLAERMRNVIENGGGGGGGITVVVNHSVNAIDAASFQTTIKRHGNIIGNEVARVLKLKGFGGK